MLHDPEVALTDYALALESFVLAFYGSRPHGVTRRYVPSFFVALGACSLLGGTFHGYFPERTQTAGGWALWLATSISLGIAAVALWRIDARLFRWPQQLTETISGAALIGYVAYLVGVDHEFRVAIFFYLPPLLALFLGLAVRSARYREEATMLGLAAVTLILAASVLQHLRIGCSALHLSYNALYHVLQAVALVPLFRSLCRLLSKVHEPKQVN